MIAKWLDKFGHWFRNTFPSKTKEGDLVKVVLAIVLIFVFCVSIVFGILSWITGIGFGWFWVALFLAYVLYCVWLYIKINSKT